MHFARLQLEVEFSEIAPGVVVAHGLRARGVTDLGRLSDLLAILASEVELARVQQRSLDTSHGRTPIVRLPG